MPAPDTTIARRLRPLHELAALPRFLAEAGLFSLESSAPRTARTMFEAVRVLAPRSPVGETGLAEALLRLGETRRAERAARRATRLVADRSTTASAYITLGKCQWHLGEHDRARQTWARARVIDPEGGAGRSAVELLERADTPGTLQFDSLTPARAPRQDGTP